MEEKHGESLHNLPPGYRFDPYIQQLITHYLKPKINGINLPTNPIHEIDYINIYAPQDLTAKFKPQGKGKKKRWYFFTSRNRKYKNGSRPDRKAGDGYWKATGKDKPIKDDDGTMIGHQRSLVYFKGKPKKDKKEKNEKTQWHMLELRVPDQPKLIHKRKQDHQQDTTTSMRLDYVICIIYPNEVAKKEKKAVQVTENNEAIKSNTEELNISSSNTLSVTNNNCNYQCFNYDYELVNSNNPISYNNDGSNLQCNSICGGLQDLVSGYNHNEVMDLGYDYELVNSNNPISYDNDGSNLQCNSIYGGLQDLVSSYNHNEAMDQIWHDHDLIR